MIKADSKEPGPLNKDCNTSKLQLAQPLAFGTLLIKPKDTGTSTAMAPEENGSKTMTLTQATGGMMKMMRPQEDGRILTKLFKDSGCLILLSHKLELPLKLKLVSGMPLMAQLELGPTTQLAMVDSGRKLMAPKEVAGAIHPLTNFLENGGMNKTPTVESGTPTRWITTSESPPQMQKVEFGTLLTALMEPGLTLMTKAADG